MNARNALVQILQQHGGFATTAELEAVKPKLRDLMKASVELVDNGLAAWEGADGKQELRLTDKTLAIMSPNARKMTHAQIRDALDRGEDLTGYSILVVKG